MRIIAHHGRFTADIAEWAADRLCFFIRHFIAFNLARGKEASSERYRCNFHVEKSYYLNWVIFITNFGLSSRVWGVLFIGDISTSNSAGIYTR